MTGKKVLIIILIILVVIFAAEIGLVVLFTTVKDQTENTPKPNPMVTVQEQVELPEIAEERLPEYFTLTFAGDCTLGSNPKKFNSAGSFVKVIGNNYDYPFANVIEYFDNDDFTFVNFEGVLANSGTAADKLFTFRGPTDYVNILTGSSVEGVTLANNHSMDFGTKGYESTKKVLEESSVFFVERDKIKLFTTESGLTIGVYADAFYFSEKDIKKNIQKLKDANAEVIVCAFHWGTEGSYRATAEQKKFARCAVSQGAHIVMGHHPHVLQATEFGENSAIFYSLGNFSFGGNKNPKDYDSALVQVQIVRELDGSIRVGTVDMIPVSVSSEKGKNNYQPTPYAPGTPEYERAMQKLLGTFTGPDLVIIRDYDKNEETTETTPPAA